MACALKTFHRLAVRYRPVSSLRLNPGNPRQHSKRQIDQIAASIRAFGMNVPVLVGEDGQVIAGHGRMLACQQLGMSTVPTIELKGLTEAQARAFAIADNRLTENAAWDERLLGESLKILSEADLDFDLETTGFETAEIDLFIEGLAPAPEEGEVDPADELGDAVEGPPVTRPGDLWELGPHRIYCGNALESGSYATLLGKKQAALVFTDPPYNVRIAGHASGLGAVKHRDFQMACGEMTEGAFTDFLQTALGHLAGSSKDGSLHFVCMDWRHIGELLVAGHGVYTELKNICVFVKDNAGMGSLYRSQHEFVAVFKKGKDRHRNNIELGRFGRNRTNVWNYPGMASFARRSEEGNLLALHPTVKPVALVADVLFDASARGEIVLDAFLGSGTTVIAAERTGRRCYGIELDPAYVDVAIRRWERYTGAEARHAASGKTFRQLARKRGQGNG